MSETVSMIMRKIAEVMETPVVILLIILIAISVFMIGWIIAEGISERRHLKVVLPVLLDDIRDENQDIAGVVKESGLLKSQKDVLLELLRHPRFTPIMRQSLSDSLLDREQHRYDTMVKISDTIAKVAPMLGLLGTLIPLGPGIIALGQGDTLTLSSSLLTAFDTTILGLITAAVALVISTIRKGWYEQYMSILETACDCVLEVEKEKYERDEAA